MWSPPQYPSPSFRRHSAAHASSELGTSTIADRSAGVWAAQKVSRRVQFGSVLFVSGVQPPLNRSPSEFPGNHFLTKPCPTFSSATKRPYGLPLSTSCPLVAHFPGTPISRNQALAIRSRRNVGSVLGMSKVSLLTP